MSTLKREDGVYIVTINNRNVYFGTLLDALQFIDDVGKGTDVTEI